MWLPAAPKASFNTQPPEGGCLRHDRGRNRDGVSTHSRPKAAGFKEFVVEFAGIVSTHSRPKAAVHIADTRFGGAVFQHTAARRRLIPMTVSDGLKKGFNTQPPEGG